MPLFHYGCPKCGAKFSKLRTPENAKKSNPKCGCGATAKRDADGATSKITETLDNGAMVKRVERPADMERLNAERARKPEDRGI